MKTVYYCIQKSTKSVLSAGFLPETWGNITGMADISEEAAADLSWAGYEDYAFLTLDAAQKLNIPKKDLDAALALGAVIQSAVVRKERDTLMQQSDWVTLKSIRTGQEIPQHWKDYMQALADIPTQSGFPWDVVYPILPQ